MVRRIAVPPAPMPSSSAARATMQGNRAADTRPELALRSALHRLGMRFRKNCRPDSRVRCRADVVFPGAKVAVFVDGCFWHRCPVHGTSPATNAPYWRAKLDRNVQRDRENDRTLESAGWTVLRVWEHESPDAAATRVAAVIREPRTG